MSLRVAKSRASLHWKAVSLVERSNRMVRSRACRLSVTQMAIWGDTRVRLKGKARLLDKKRHDALNRLFYARFINTALLIVQREQ